MARFAAQWLGWSGRLGRAGYAVQTGVALGLLIAANLAFMGLWLLSPPEWLPRTVPEMVLNWRSGPALALVLVAAWIALSASARRLHDLGRSGLWLAVVLVPEPLVAGAAAVLGGLWLTFAPGEPGANGHGVLHDIMFPAQV